MRVLLASAAFLGLCATLPVSAISPSQREIAKSIRGNKKIHLTEDHQHQLSTFDSKKDEHEHKPLPHVPGVGRLSQIGQDDLPTQTTVHWNNTLHVGQCMVSFSLVPTPIFNASATPVTETVWKGAADLKAQRPRFLSWSVYPEVTVPELSPPIAKTQTTSWDFTNFMSVFDRFMNISVHHDLDNPPLLCISTFPEWFIDGTVWNITGWAPNEVNYAYGYTGGPQLNTTWLLARYYGRIASWLVKGEFRDEFDKLHTGGPAYGLERIKYWEVMEEPDCGALTSIGPMGYVSLYDAIVTEIRNQVDPDHKIQFTGGVFCVAWEINTWWRAFLTPQNHVIEVRDAINGVSQHYYGYADHRYNRSYWAQDIWPQLDQFIKYMREAWSLKEELSPNTEMYIDEFGLQISAGWSNNVPLDPQWWRLGNAHDWVAYAEFSAIGINMIGNSQYMGNYPVAPNIPNRQNPAESMINWTTGIGNARYWGAKLLLEEFSLGDEIVDTVRAPRSVLCAEKWNKQSWPVNDNNSPPPSIELWCPVEGTWISGFTKADVKRQFGSCETGHWTTSNQSNCSDHGTMLKAAMSLCVGARRCTLDLNMATYKDNNNTVSQCTDTVNFVVQATCSDGTPGYATPSGYKEDNIHLQSRLVKMTHKETNTTVTKKKVLFVNKLDERVTLRLPGMTGGTVRFVQTDKDAPIESIHHDYFELDGWAAGIITMPGE